MPNMERDCPAFNQGQPHGPGIVAKRVWIFDEVVAGAGHCPLIKEFLKERVCSSAPAAST